MAQSTSDQIEPLDVSTQKDLEQLFREISPFFEGKETEQNWSLREKSILKLRKLAKGNAPNDFPISFIAGIKALLDGILKTVNSLRTTVSSNGCHFVQEVAKSIGPGLDSMVEILLQDLIKLCAGTKKISAQNGNNAVNAILGHVSYSIRLMNHLWNACQDKNVQPRTFATTWLKTVIITHGVHKSYFEHTGGLDLCEKCIKRGLGDANAGVREGMRSTFWVFEKNWPDRAASITSSLDDKHRGLLENHPDNPHSKIESKIPSSEPISSKTTSLPNTKAGATARVSVRDTILAQRKAAKEAALIEKTVPEITSVQSASTMTTGTLSSAPIRPRKAISKSIRKPGLVSSAKGSSISSSNSSRKTNSEKGHVTDPKKGSKETAKIQEKPVSISSGNSITHSMNKVQKKSVSVSNSKLTTDSKASTKKVANVQNKPAFASSGRPFRSSSLSSAASSNKSAEKDHITDSKASTKKVANVQNKPAFASSGRPFRSSSLSSAASSNKSAEKDHFTDSKASTKKVANVQKKPAFTSSGKATTSFSLEKDHITDSKTSPKKIEKVQTKPVFVSSGRPNRASSLSSSTSSRKGTPEQDHVTDPKEGSKQSDQILEKPVSISSGNSTTSSSISTSISDQTSEVDPELQEIRLFLAGGIFRVQSNTIDIQLFRKLQGLIDTNLDVWEDGAKFGDLLLSLLDYLERPIDAPKPVSANVQDLNTQALVTVRMMLEKHQKLFQPFFPRALCALITASSGHVSDRLENIIEDAADDIIQICTPTDCITAVLDTLEVYDGHGATKMGLKILGTLLHNVPRGHIYASKQEKDVLGEDDVRRIATVILGCFRADDPEVRGAAVDCSLDVHDYVGNDDFWVIMAGASEHRRMMISYYMEKRMRQFSGF